MARQLHYTSAATGRTGRAGFQFVATSPSVTPDLERLIEPFMTYRPPPGPRHPDACPVSLAYDLTPQGAVFVCCRYLGTDYSGRDGNFFGHAIVANVDELDGVRPIELWRAPVWSPAPASVTSLPELAHIEPGEVLDPHAVASFLTNAGVEAYRLLTVLLDAVRATLSGQAGPIRLVCDNVEATCHWIAAISYSLPFDTVSGLSFVTYTADPMAARHHLVGTTEAAWSSSGGDGVVFWLDQLRPPESVAPPSRYATAVTRCWRTHDLAGIDLLCEVATLAGRTDENLDAAAALLALCAGELVAPREQEAISRLLRAAPAGQRAALLDRMAAAFTRRPVDEALTGLLNGALTDLLADRDWTTAPELGRHVLTAYGRRHIARRAEVTERLVALQGAGLLTRSSLAEAVGQLWSDQTPTVAEVIRVLDSLDPTTAGQPELRRLAAQALRQADPTDSATVRLAQILERSAPLSDLPAAADRTEPAPASEAAPANGAITEAPDRDGTAGGSGGIAAGSGDGAASPVDEAAGSARLILNLHALSQTYAPDLVVGSLTALGQALSTADPGLAERVLQGACTLLAGRPVPHRVAVLIGLEEQMRVLIVDQWLRTSTADEAGQTDLAEIATRLYRAGVCPPPLQEYVRSLVRRPLAHRRLARLLAARDRELVPSLRELVHAGQWWRFLFGREG